jgi:murein DD-endopeptidase MepM/ murein hydrolase activator NlpD
MSGADGRILSGGRRGWLLAVLLIASCVGTAPPPPPRLLGPRQPPALPDSAGFGNMALAIERSPRGWLWVGTYGRGIYLLPPDSGGWERIAVRPNDSTSISWNFVNSFAFTRDSIVWYGTVGNGFGRTRDRGRTWRNWTVNQLGPEWQYVAADGIRTRGDTVFIATADGLRISWDDGQSWRCIQAVERIDGGAAPRSDACTERINSLPTEYLLSLELARNGEIWVGHLKGASVSRDLGRTWTTPRSSVPIDVRVRAIETDSLYVWLAGETRYFKGEVGEPIELMEPRAPGWPALPGQPRALETMPGLEWPLIATSFGLSAPGPTGDYHVHYLPAGERFRPAADVYDVIWLGTWPVAGTGTGLARALAGEFPATPPAQRAPAPENPRHALFSRPIASGDGNPYVDATYRYGSTMGGNFQQHQGVEFNNPAGTPVRAIGDGVVVFAGKAEAGANTVAIQHDQRLGAQYVFSTYFHNSSLQVRSGQRVRAGDVIARVGNSGRATNDHLHLEVHVAPGTDSSKIVHPDVRFPPHTVNPQLWLEPLPGTGLVAGTVLDANGQPVPGARIYGLVQPYPEETPLAFVETYQDRAHAHPLYNEHFAIGDIPAGEYLLGTQIGTQKVWRRVNVQAGRVTFVEFRPN